MKKLYFTLIAVILISLVVAQTPQAFKYQAIARDKAGNILINNPIGLRISMVEGHQDGIAKYIEIHTVKLADQVSGVNWRNEVPTFTGDLGRILPVLPNLVWLPM